MNKLAHAFALLREFFYFARHHKVWWIVPLVLALGVVIALVAVGQVSAPFLYTLF